MELKYRSDARAAGTLRADDPGRLMREVLLDTDDLSQSGRAYQRGLRERQDRKPLSRRLGRYTLGSFVRRLHGRRSRRLRLRSSLRTRPFRTVSVFHVRSGSLVSTTRQPDGRRLSKGDVGLAGPMQGSRSPGRSNEPATTSFSWIVRCSQRSLPAYLTMAPSRLCSRVNRLCPQAPVRIWRG